LGEKVFDHSAVILILDAREELSAEFPDRFGLIERQTVVNPSAGEVTGHAFRLEDWF